MGLKIKSKIHTDLGGTEAAYINISSMHYEKEAWIGAGHPVNSLSVKINTYLNKETRETNSKETAITRSIKNSYAWIDEGSPSPLHELKEGASMFKVAYTLIKQELETKGLVVEDDI